ncbi:MULTISPECIES: F0F1 ATP synthase subunit A [Pseudothermotoga]|uniref:ATP synthase subunit a n=1 Tax=Pseudothermotoga lettingae (strain ATCC BAA-301 / DSM 14385 / NBRC 107922 / TMO) TaxID=416591 RepID=A8F3J6_PSELT|nr:MULTISPECIES: F0F1 ATP synthase subunit A [Pseudothermotoga]ABV32730.1 ATP synthase F0, A subunit [Pseudothermotoga lettingae TMO]KUK20657.1 MAG: ATP synthase subunit a [Pseudothermotoga lettingae]MDK2885263.1 F-type H+-transporting ATPase subunit a [Pseudothermotoga sp.]GLI48277.1 ATP synthase subunit a [Pseudothermotoga lettingae TMO]HBT25451.1 F0F1 ATP synthase subunit A [Pseudothermotoga sp.]
MKISLDKRAKVLLAIFLVVYIVVGVLNAIYLSKQNMGEAFKNVANRWVVDLPFGKGIFSRINPLTIFMTWGIMAAIILIALRLRKPQVVPDRKQSLVESLLEFVYNMVEDAVPDQRFVRPTFYIACTLFIFIVFSNILGGAIPGISIEANAQGTVEKIHLFSDTWFSPTADINTNAFLAVFVFIISQVFAIKSKGIKSWAKSWFEPIPFMFPMNVIGELSKPISHSLRLFGNIAGGALLTYLLAYMAKYLFLPVILWGFFGLFVGVIQALVFTVLAIAYISSALS